MKAVYISEPGGPEVLELREVPSPVPGPGEVLIDVVAAGMNRADVHQRQGLYPPPPGASEILGPGGFRQDRRLWPGCDQTVLLGDKVVALLAGGGYADQVAVPAGQVLRIPDGVDLVTAASLPEIAATVYSNLIMTAQLQAGGDGAHPWWHGRHRRHGHPAGEGLPAPALPPRPARDEKAAMPRRSSARTWPSTTQEDFADEPRASPAAWART